MEDPEEKFVWRMRTGGGDAGVPERRLVGRA